MATEEVSAGQVRRNANVHHSFTLKNISMLNNLFITANRSKYSFLLRQTELNIYPESLTHHLCMGHCQEEVRYGPFYSAYPTSASPNISPDPHVSVEPLPLPPLSPMPDSPLSPWTAESPPYTPPHSPQRCPSTPEAGSHSPCRPPLPLYPPGFEPRIDLTSSEDNQSTPLLLAAPTLPSDGELTIDLVSSDDESDENCNIYQEYILLSENGNSRDERLR